MKGLIFILAFYLISCNNNPSSIPSIAISSNTRFAIEEIVDSFTLKTGQELKIITGSSGKLTG